MNLAVDVAKSDVATPGGSRIGGGNGHADVPTVQVVATGEAVCDAA